MDNRSPLAIDGIPDSERVAGLLRYGAVKDCLTESLYWMRYNPSTDGPTDIADGTAPVEGMPDNDVEAEALNVAVRLQNRALALLTFKPTMYTQELILTAMKRDTDSWEKYERAIVFLIPEEVNRLHAVEPTNCGFIRNSNFTQLFWRLEGDRLTVSECIG